MKTIDPILLEALEKGKGTPVMVCALYKYEIDGWTLKGEYDVLECILARSRYDLFVQENLLAAGLVDSVVTSAWAIEIERGLIVGGVKYSLVSNLYYISSCTYSDHWGSTHIIADLLPTTSIIGIDGTQTAQQVITQAFEQFNNLATISFDVTRDIWFGWKFYDIDKDLNLIDGRTLEEVLQQKYFAYLFPRWFHLIYAYGVASNDGNNVDGTYTPFDHARTTSFLSTDKPINLTWDSETGYNEYIDTVTNGVASLGFISVVDNPSAISKFQNWTRVFNGVLFQYIQRPDLRLEQGDLLKVSTDGFTKTRCFEMIEVYKSSNLYAKAEGGSSWYQIVRQLPYHPQYAIESIVIDDHRGKENQPIGTPPTTSGGGSSGGGGVPVTPHIQRIIIPGKPNNLNYIMSASFTGILSQDASNVQQAFELLDKHNHDTDYAPAAHGHDEDDLSFTDVTTNNASTSKHGLLIKATAPSSYILNVLGITNGDTGWGIKQLLNEGLPAALGTRAAGVSYYAAKLDHVHEAQVIPDLSGWTPVTDTWTYASANTVNVPTGAAARYAVGDKIMFTQSTPKFFYVTAIADTLLTLYAGSEFTVANSTISSIYHSHMLTPVGHTFYFPYTPTGIAASNVALEGRFYLLGRRIHVDMFIYFNGTITFTTMPTLPIAAASTYRGAIASYSIAGRASYLNHGTSYVLDTIFPTVATSGTVCGIYQPAGGPISATNPITWDTGDSIELHIDYQI